MHEYTQSEKNTARTEVLRNAITTLTKQRSKSPLARRTYVREVKEYISTQQSEFDQRIANQLSDETISKWESFYDSIVEKKKPSNLKIAYLSGPSPENDLRVMCSLGVLPENIWAFESDNKTYTQAVTSALASEFKFIKIINGGIDRFLETSLIRFDIIYLDFCGPLPSRNKSQRTLGTITKILANHSIAPLGILITNVALPDVDQDQQGRELIGNLVSSYLFPKGFLESGKKSHNLTDGPITSGNEYSEFKEEVSKDLENYYGQFITRVLIDLVSIISPYDRSVVNDSIFKIFFKLADEKALNEKIQKMFHFNEEYDGGDVITDSDCYPLLWSLAALVKELNAGDGNYPNDITINQNFAAFASLFVRELSSNYSEKEIRENILQITYLLREEAAPEFLSEAMANLKNNHRHKEFYQFCDLFLSHQAMELLYRQVVNAYHINIKATKRWTYKAKSTQMFMDMIVLDECRYLYDWMPTVNMFGHGIKDIERQLSYRFVLDAICKQSRWYVPEILFGTAVINQDTKPFEAKILYPREIISKG